MPARLLRYGGFFSVVISPPSLLSADFLRMCLDIVSDGAARRTFDHSIRRYVPKPRFLGRIPTAPTQYIRNWLRRYMRSRAVDQLPPELWDEIFKYVFLDDENPVRPLLKRVAFDLASRTFSNAVGVKITPFYLHNPSFASKKFIERGLYAFGAYKDFEFVTLGHLVLGCAALSSELKNCIRRVNITLVLQNNWSSARGGWAATQNASRTRAYDIGVDDMMSRSGIRDRTGITVIDNPNLAIRRLSEFSRLRELTVNVSHAAYLDAHRHVRAGDTWTPNTLNDQDRALATLLEVVQSMNQAKAEGAMDIRVTFVDQERNEGIYVDLANIPVVLSILQDDFN
ncbi:hypothetical protein NA57DRAFT_74766 [Rhizodiscina lignyota]|uniref:Uncharacterized protein n=1 Tax=Rhizodiscina lignyota TaxID=1504668 RepID=A0A9P4IH94_9PEZI|nr:hypothetical protein NA57DRAFT_74766 [Rhizodiscina lignyota]